MGEKNWRGGGAHVLHALAVRSLNMDPGDGEAFFTPLRADSDESQSTLPNLLKAT